MFLTGCFLWSKKDQPRVPNSSDEVLPYQNEIISYTQKRMGYTAKNIKVYWVDGICPTGDDSRPAIVYRGRCYAGYTISCKEIYVARRETAAKSALVHEVGHCLRLANGMDGDARHEDKLWWDKNEQVKKEVRENGW